MAPGSLQGLQLVVRGHRGRPRRAVRAAASRSARSRTSPGARSSSSATRTATAGPCSRARPPASSVRVLFASTRGTGHFNPLVPFIEACVRGGHEVMVAGPPPLAERSSAPATRSGRAPSRRRTSWAPSGARVPTVSPEEANAIVVGEIFGGLNVRAMLPSLTRRVRGVAAGRCDPRAGRVRLGDRRRAPRRCPTPGSAVSLAGLEEMGSSSPAPPSTRSTPACAERDLDLAVPHARPAPRSRTRRPTRPPAMHRFRDPAARRAGAAAARTGGRATRARSSTSASAAWPATMPIAGALYAAVLEAAAELPARVLLTLGHATPTSTRSARRPPTCAWSAGWPRPTCSPQADVVVSHGGFGTTLGARGRRAAAGGGAAVRATSPPTPAGSRPPSAPAWSSGRPPDDAARADPRQPSTRRPLREAVETVLEDPRLRGARRRAGGRDGGAAAGRRGARRALSSRPLR